MKSQNPLKTNKIAIKIALKLIFETTKNTTKKIKNSKNVLDLFKIKKPPETKTSWSILPGYTKATRNISAPKARAEWEGSWVRKVVPLPPINWLNNILSKIKTNMINKNKGINFLTNFGRSICLITTYIRGPKHNLTNSKKEKILKDEINSRNIRPLRKSRSLAFNFILKNGNINTPNGVLPDVKVKKLKVGKKFNITKINLNIFVCAT